MDATIFIMSLTSIFSIPKDLAELDPASEICILYSCSEA